MTEVNFWSQFRPVTNSTSPSLIWAATSNQMTNPVNQVISMAHTYRIVFILCLYPGLLLCVPGGPNCGPSGEGFFIDLGYQNEESYNPIVTVCFDPVTARSIYAHSIVYKEIVARDTSNDRPSFKSDGYYDFDVADAYTRVKQ